MSLLSRLRRAYYERRHRMATPEIRGTGTCHYWQVLKSGKIEFHNHRVCFGDANWNEMAELRYLCLVQPWWEPVHTRFWVRFCRYWLTDLEWTAQEIKIGQAKHKAILFRLKTTPTPDKPKNLLFGTAFRYAQKYPSVVKRLYDERAKVDDPEGLFALWQKMHIEGAYQGDASKKAYGDLNIGGTGEDIATSHPYYGSDLHIRRALSIAEIKARLAVGKRTTVYSYFTPEVTILPESPVPV
jgi:hypothetical protein